MDPHAGPGRGRSPRPPVAAEVNPPARPKPRPRRLGKSLVALSSAAILSVYAVGYVHTQSAEQQLAAAALPPPTGAGAGAAAGATPGADPAPASAQQVRAVPTAAATPAASATLPPLGAAARGTTAGIAGATVSTPAPTAPPAPATAPTVAPTPVPTVAPTPVPTPRPTVASGYQDGQYTGIGTSRHGSVEVAVSVANGKITSVQITGCMTRYPCSWISALPGEVLQTQSARVNYVSGATDSSRAFIGAVTSALQSALA